MVLANPEHGASSWSERMRHARWCAIEYLLERQSPGGGFCFYRTAYVDEPNLSDTFHAVAALHLLGEDIPRIEFLHGYVAKAASESRQPTSLYYCLETLYALDSDLHVNDSLRGRIMDLQVSAPPAPNHGQVRGWLERVRLIVQLQRRVDAIRNGAQIRDYVFGLHRNGGFGARANLWDSWLGLAILEQCGASIEQLQTTAFVDALQDPVQGFTSTRLGRMTSLEVVTAGLRCCALLGLPVRYSQPALTFVLACQTVKGGFARTPSALADVEQTHNAIESMLALRGHPGLFGPQSEPTEP